MSWLDFFNPRVLEEFTSPFNGLIRVMELPGNRYISTGNLTQSGELVREVWQKTLSRLSRPRGKSWLILGLAGGTIAKFVSAANHPSEIVGIEIDPVMVTIGKKYFGLDQIRELKIVTVDAIAYLKNSKEQFNCLLVDMYFGDTPPKFIYTPQFIQSLKSHTKVGGTVVFNHLFYDADKKQAAEKLVNILKHIFPKVELTRKLSNLLIICS